jgi:SAM-dependent methyltransferase
MQAKLNPGGDARTKALYDDKAGYAKLHFVSQRACRREPDDAESDLIRTGIERLPVLDEAECAKLRTMIDAESDFLRSHLFRVSLMAKIFVGAVDRRIAGYFGSEYLPLWCRFMRSDPGGEPNVSFSWHCDGGPTKHLKVLLYLNGSDEHGGNTRFLDRATTDAFKKIGYVFCDIAHRLDDLAALAGEHGIPYRPLEAPMRTGEAILFEPANVLHKGVWPTRAPRYLLQICIVPSPMPWRDACTLFPVPRDDHDWPVVDKHWPARRGDSQPARTEAPTRPAKMPRRLDLTPEDWNAVNRYVAANPAELLQIPTVRAMLAESRLARVDPKAIETLDPSDGRVHAHALEHNLTNLKKQEAADRPSTLVYPLRGIEYILRNARALKVLTVGPRSESEIFSLIAAGISPDNITGLDLISYSDFVALGDMHAMPFEDDSFDIVIVGWVLTYSADNRRAADEILRVARPGAHIAIGCATEPVDEAAAFERARTATGGVRAKIGDGSKTLSIFFNTEQILRLFEGRIDTVIFRQDPHPALRHERANATVIFRLKS